MRIILIIASLAAICFIGYGTMAGEDGWFKLQNLRDERQVLLQQNAELAKENEQFQEEIEALNGDPIMLERVAREQLGMVGPDEIILQFKP